MASGENQGLQISLIVFVILTILLGVGTFFAFRSYQEEVVKTKALEETAKKTQADITAAKDAAEQLKQIIGVDPAMPMGDPTDGKDGLDKATVHGTVNADMIKYAATFPEAKRHYRQAIEEHQLKFDKANTELFARNDEVKQLKDINETREKAKQPQIDEHEKQRKAAETDLASEKGKIAEERKTINSDKEQLLTVAQEKEKAFVALQTEKKSEIDKRIAELASLGKINDDKTKVIEELRGEGFEVADGEIRSVNAGMHTVWINLGRADQLRNQLSFSVYDPKANTNKGEGLKGSIEVTAIIGEHLAVARIVNDDISNPIVNGDKIYTPLWHPGRGEHFAIMGKIDLDGDGKHDAELIKNMISMAGGAVDAELDEKGKLTGSGMNKSTRYLLTGEISIDKAISEAATAMTNQAKQLGIREIEVTKFLDLVGWKDPKQVLRFGRTGNAANQTPPEPDGGRPVAVSHLKEQFKKRLPPAAARKSAYDEKMDATKAPAKDATKAPAKAPAQDQKQEVMP